MRLFELTERERNALLALALGGALIPNGIFCYYFLTSPETTRDALTNPISVVFIFEALVLMLVFAWLLGRLGQRRPGGIAFIVMSLLGSMMFSVPFTLRLLSRRQRKAKVSEGEVGEKP